MYKLLAPRKANGFYAYKTKFLERLPIRAIDFSEQSDVAQHDRVVTLVQQITSLHEQLAEAKVPSDKTALQTQINNTDKHLNQLVYELYNLTEEEIEIVEG